MGTWIGPVTNEQRKALSKKLKTLKKLHDEISGLFGDDELLDSFITSESRIEWSLEHIWTNHNCDIPLEVFRAVREISDE
jgi:hypothetical protein